ncbi:HupE/UreJ family protein [Sphingobium sp. CECT 9361]|uniref:HupE/UreJ family protein n=1 Tax=Sphingobium sp. CECT 9361 TaxID=2845384 RepID=UPI001E6372D9|nr:HupE/UreJ family protein [Sphingobium sp. CECT 9361]
MRRLLTIPSILFAAVALQLIGAHSVLAHDVAQSDRAFVAATQGQAIMPFLYLGAKHMVTGYDHILFLVGVVMFLFRLRDVVLYVSLFTLGHSLTLMLGVIFHIGANSHVVDAIIGLSIIYKGAENLGLLRTLGWRVDTRLAVLAFGLCHGLGLAAKLLSLSISPDGLLVNLLSFNVGVEIGQIIVLFFVVCLLNLVRNRSGFAAKAAVANWLLIVSGAAIMFHQTSEYLAS